MNSLDPSTISLNLCCKKCMGPVRRICVLALGLKGSRAYNAMFQVTPDIVPDRTPLTVS